MDTQGHRKDFWAGLAVIGVHETCLQFLNISIMNSLHCQKSVPAKTGPAGLAKCDWGGVPILTAIMKYAAHYLSTAIAKYPALTKNYSN